MRLSTAALLALIALSTGLSDADAAPFDANAPVDLALAPPNVEALLAEDDVDMAVGGKPWRYGAPTDVHLDLDTLGTWSEAADGARIWTARVQSPGAHHISLIFSSVELGPASTLTLWSPEHGEIVFTAADNGPLASSPILGDTVDLRLIDPPGRASSQLELKTVVHAYRNLFGPDHPQVVGASGGCNVNTACSEADPWRDQVASAVMIDLGFSLCSGTLMNNTAEDQRPIVLTANHCLGGNLGNWNFWFNYESDSCTNPASEPPADIVRGATLLARSGDSDMGLIELNRDVPEDFGAYYAGWDVSGRIPQSAAAIHHPSGDIKKISLENNRLQQSGRYWYVVDWDAGTTEGGSSGSGLYDETGHVVGHLFGGAAACGNNQGDEYGAIWASWDGTGASLRLRDHLDPIGSGVTVLEGFGAGSYDVEAALTLLSPADGGTSCGTAIVRIQNRGAEDLTRADLEVTVDGDTFTERWSGRLALNETENVSIDLGVGSGSHTVEVTLVDPNGDEDPVPGNNSGSATFTGIDVQGELPPIFVDFDGSLPPTRQEPSDRVGWEIIDLGYESVAGMNNRDEDTSGTIDALQIGTVDLTGSGDGRLQFNVAYAPWGGEYVDGVRVVGVGECDGVQTVLWEAYGDDLATAPSTEDLWRPGEDQWMHVDVDLSSLEGQIATIEIQNMGGWGQWVYVDAVELTASSGFLGCGCASSPASSAWWLIGPLVLIVGRRRRDRDAS